MNYDFATPTDSTIPSSLNLLGIGFDGTACFRKGAADGPDAIRQASNGIESYSPYLDRDLSSLTFYDLGNIVADRTLPCRRQWEDLEDGFSKRIHWRDEKSKFLILGGEHSISYFPIRACLGRFEDLLLIHLDAHADLRDGYQGFHYSHASVIRRVLDHFGPHHELVQYGIRSGTREEYRWMKSSGTLVTSLEELLEKIDNVHEARSIYLTLDLDFFDPAFLPGTGTPEPGGESFHSFAKLVKLLCRKNVVGADVVELAPSIDPTGNSSVFAAKVVRELVLALSWENV